MLRDLNCPNCGASLPPQAADSDVITCQYCHTTFRVPKTLTPEPTIGDLILGADFRQTPIAGWNFPNKDDVRLMPGNPPELRARFSADDGLYYALNTSGYFDDLDAGVGIRFGEGDVEHIRAGLVVRYQKEVGSYGVLVSAQGTYMIGYYEKSPDGNLGWKTLLDWTKHSALHGGLNQPNRLRAIADGDRLRVYLNGVLATSRRDSRYELGEVLLAAETGGKSSIEVSFFDLQLREAPKA